MHVLGSSTIRRRNVAVVCLLALALFVSAQAQVPPVRPVPPGQTRAPAQTPPPATSPGISGSFSGRLNGAGMDAATVTVTNTATGVTQTVVTDADGRFTITSLTPGTYKLVVKLKSGLLLPENSVEVTTTSGNQIQVTFPPLPPATPIIKVEQTP